MLLIFWPSRGKMDRLRTIWMVLFFLSCLLSSQAAILDGVANEDDARKTLAPKMENLKTFDPNIWDELFRRQWWTVAKEVVLKSHTQKVDMSIPVRKSVKKLKDEADELVRMLNPKYFEVQEVSPAFQWAQDPLHVYLNVKFTVRWNAPGAINLENPKVLMDGNSFNFTGISAHSGNKYLYSLGLVFFDYFKIDQSTWSLASVGKLSVTLKKNWARKWPRLLLDRSQKISNMHVWKERQDALEGSFSGFSSSTVAHSPATCALRERLFCLDSDTCLHPTKCGDCKGKPTPVEAEHICAGPPMDNGQISFQDTDMDEQQLGGPITITKAKNENDIDQYVIYWGSNDYEKIDSAPVGRVNSTGEDVSFKLKQGTKPPEGATHLLVWSENKWGEYPHRPPNTNLQDRVLPWEKAQSLLFQDMDGGEKEIGGVISIQQASDEKWVEQYCLHWGKTATKKISGASLITELDSVTKDDKQASKLRRDKSGKSFYEHRIGPVSNLKIPQTAKYMIVFTKNQHGEMKEGISMKIEDKLRPCYFENSKGCPTSISVSEDTDNRRGEIKAQITIERAEKEESFGVTHYALYWGRLAKEDKCSKLGFIQDVVKPESNDPKIVFHLTAGWTTKMPAGATHVHVFSKNSEMSMGHESEWCKSAVVKDAWSYESMGGEEREEELTEEQMLAELWSRFVPEAEGFMTKDRLFEMVRITNPDDQLPSEEEYASILKTVGADAQNGLTKEQLHLMYKNNAADQLKEDYKKLKELKEL